MVPPIDQLGAAARRRTVLLALVVALQALPVNVQGVRGHLEGAHQRVDRSAQDEDPRLDPGERAPAIVLGP